MRRRTGTFDVACKLQFCNGLVPDLSGYTPPAVWTALERAIENIELNATLLGVSLEEWRSPLNCEVLSQTAILNVLPHKRIATGVTLIQISIGRLIFLQQLSDIV